MKPEYKEHALKELDTRFIETLWSFNPKQYARHRVLPDGRIDLLTRFRQNSDGSIFDVRPVIAGPAQRFITVPADQSTGFFGIRFRPGWGALCLGLNASEIRDSALVGSETMPVIGTLAGPLLQATNANELKCRLIDIAQILVDRLPQSMPQARAIESIEMLVRSGGRRSVASLAHDTGTSVRTLHRDFTSVVGLSVKSFASILRFQHTMRLLRSQPSMALAELACVGGYSDQSHMTREFRYLGGFTPALRPDVPIINLSS